MTEQYDSQVHSILSCPEVVARFPGEGNVAVDAVYSKESNLYQISIGERVGEEMKAVAISPWRAIPHGETLSSLIDKELLPFGERARIFDVFVEGKLVRSAGDVSK